MNKTEAPPKLVKSAIRTIELFSVFADAKRPLSLAELAGKMGAPKSSCHELIQTLIHLGYIIAINEGRSYYPSRRLFEMAEQINTFNPIKEKIENQLKHLRDLTGETVFIGRLHGESVVYTEVFDGTHTIRYTARSGDVKSVHASALGKALLGSLDDADRNRLIGNLKLTRYNDNTITGKKALKDNLEQCRRLGVYTTVGEQFPDVMGMAFPVEVQGHLLAIGLAGPINRMEQNFTTYRKALMAAVANSRP